MKSTVLQCRISIGPMLLPRALTNWFKLVNQLLLSVVGKNGEKESSKTRETKEDHAFDCAVSPDTVIRFAFGKISLLVLFRERASSRNPVVAFVKSEKREPFRKSFSLKGNDAVLDGTSGFILRHCRVFL